MITWPHLVETPRLGNNIIVPRPIRCLLDVQANRKCPCSSVAFVPHATDPTRMRLPSRLAAISSFVLLPSRLAAISLAVRPCFPDWRQCRSVLASAFPPGGSRFFNALTSRLAVSASCVFALPDWRQTHSRPPAWRPLIPAADESARSAAVAVSLSLQISRTKLRSLWALSDRDAGAPTFLSCVCSIVLRSPPIDGFYTQIP